MGRSDKYQKDEIHYQKGDEWYLMSVYELLDNNFEKTHTLKRGSWFCYSSSFSRPGIWAYHELTDSDTVFKLKRVVNSQYVIFSRKDTVEKRRGGDSIPSKLGCNKSTTNIIFANDNDCKDIFVYSIYGKDQISVQWNIYTAIDHELKKIIGFAIVANDKINNFKEEPKSEEYSRTD